MMKEFEGGIGGSHRIWSLSGWWKGVRVGGVCGGEEGGNNGWREGGEGLVKWLRGMDKGGVEGGDEGDVLSGALIGRINKRGFKVFRMKYEYEGKELGSVMLLVERKYEEVRYGEADYGKCKWNVWENMRDEGIGGWKGVKGGCARSEYGGEKWRRGSGGGNGRNVMGGMGRGMREVGEGRGIEGTGGGGIEYELLSGNGLEGIDKEEESVDEDVEISQWEMGRRREQEDFGVRRKLSMSIGDCDQVGWDNGFEDVFEWRYDGGKGRGLDLFYDYDCGVGTLWQIYGVENGRCGNGKIVITEGGGGCDMMWGEKTPLMEGVVDHGKEKESVIEHNRDGDEKMEESFGNVLIEGVMNEDEQKGRGEWERIRRMGARYEDVWMTEWMDADGDLIDRWNNGGGI
ncbi:hypothetical protein Tco_0077374 [Tanacetum coccineum]